MTDHENHDVAEAEGGQEHVHEPADELLHTGVTAVDEALATLDGLGERPVSEHAEVFEAVHGQLRRALSGEPEA